MPSIPRSQSASATGFMPAYFKPGNNSQRGMPIMVSGLLIFFNTVSNNL